VALVNDVARLGNLPQRRAEEILRQAQFSSARVLQASEHCLCDDDGTNGTPAHSEIVGTAFIQLGDEQWMSPVCRNHLKFYQSDPHFTVVMKQ